VALRLIRYIKIVLHIDIFMFLCVTNQIKHHSTFHGHDSRELYVLHALEGHHLFREDLYGLAVPLEHDDVHAGLLIEEDVERRQHELRVVVLDPHEAVHEPFAVLFVNDGYDADPVPVHRIHPVVILDVVPDGVPDAFGPRGIAPVVDDLVEPAQQAVRQRDAYAH
jgi:hypothetical protein